MQGPMARTLLHFPHPPVMSPAGSPL